MAYMNQERKSKIQPKVKEILKKYGVKGRLGVEHHATLVLNITEGVIDFIGNTNEVCSNDYYQVANGFTPRKDSIDVNVYHIDKHFSGTALKFLKEVYAVMMVGNHNNSQIEVDYHDVGWYVDINIGKWNKPYSLVD